MKTQLINISNSNNKIELLEKLKVKYENNAVVVIPTETVYGLSADATRYEAVKKIFTAKGRPSDNPLIVHFYSLDQLDNIVYYNDEKIMKLILSFWPGPMSLILNLKDNNNIAKNVTAGLNTLAVRMPSNKTARMILKETKILLAAPSANTSGKPSPTQVNHVIHDMDGRVDVIVEDEPSEIGLESTVIDCTRYPFVIARPGSITKEDIEDVLGIGSVKYNDEIMEIDTAPIAPGMKYRHYSPEAEFIMYEDNEINLLELLKNKDKRICFITYKNKKNMVEHLPITIKYLADNEKDVEQANKNLYNILRECDLENIKTIYILPIEENDNNKALLNRINKAISKK